MHACIEIRESAFTSNYSQLTQQLHADPLLGADSLNCRRWPSRLKYRRLRHPHEASHSPCATVEYPAGVARAEEKFRNVSVEID
jgi:hypothetical protein